MNIRRHAQAMLLVSLSVVATDALACGEVMYRMGGALRYHAFITKHPAQILLYASTAARAAHGNDTQAFHRNLEKAGHTVTVIDGPEGLSRVLAEHRYDVIIADAADLPAINAQIAHAAHEPFLIPLFARGNDEHSIREHYPLALKEDANLNQFLKVIEQSMKVRGT